MQSKNEFKVYPRWTLLMCWFCLSIIIFTGSRVVSGKERAYSSCLTDSEKAWLKAHPIIKVAPDPEFKPIEFFDEKGCYTGMAADYLKLVEQKLGIKFEIVRCENWDDVTQRIKHREVDVLNAVVKTPQREAYLTFPPPYLKIPSVIISRQSVDDNLTLSMLKGMKIAMVSGYGYVDIIRQKYPEVTIELVPELMTALRKVSFGMVDAFVGDLATASFYIESEGITNLKLVGDTDPPNVSGFAVRSDWQELSTILEKGMNLISRDEEKAIHKRWLHLTVEPWITPQELKKYALISAGITLFIITCFFIWNRQLKRVVNLKTGDLTKEIEERRRTEAALQESENRYHTFFEKGPDGIVILNPETTGIIEFNDQACQQLGYTREEFKQLRISDIEAKESVEEIRAHIQTIFDEEYDDFETLQRTKQGEIRHVHVTAQVIKGTGGPIYHYIWRDITNRKRVEAALRESEEKYRLAMEAVSDGIWDWNIETNEVFFSQGWSTILSENSVPPEYETWQSRIHPDDKDEVLSSLENHLEGNSEHWIKEHRLLTKTGDWKWVLGRGRVVNWTVEGSPLRMVGTMTDISELKRTDELLRQSEEQLIQAQKMEAVGRLAGGVAHDFNNMLNVIIGYTDMALDAAVPSQPIYKQLEEIRRAGERSANLTRQLLAFARKQTVAPKVLDLNKTLMHMTTMLRRLMGEDIDIAWLPGENLWPVKVDPNQIDQILVNLCVNARDAIEDVGTVTIETGNVALDDAYCSDHLGLMPGEYVLLAVSDDGCGMGPETLEHIFEPFFTTKKPGKGTGLGLATVYGVVKQNEGFINIYSKPGQGSTFKIYLPRHLPRSQAIPDKSKSLPTKRGHETIMLVEDEVSILRMTALMLERLGYQVIQASLPGEAIRLAQEQADEIHLLVTDVVMPEMNGRDLAKRIISLFPNMKRLFMSGYTADVIAHHGILNEGINFIQKPFSGEQLGKKVREVLDGGGEV